MCIMRLSVVYNEVTVSVKIEDRITILRGDSGNCKSLLVSKLFDVTDDLVDRYSDMPYLRFPLTAMDTIATTKDIIYIVDDELLFKSGRLRKRFQKFITDYAVENNLYFLIIERATSDFKELSYNVHSILKMEERGINNYVSVEMYDYLNDRGMASEIITEDKTDGYYFAKKIFNTIPVRPSVNGKSDFVKEGIGKSNFTALVDMYAFGCHVQEFADRSIKDGRRLFYNFGSLEAVLWQLYGGDLCYDCSVLSREMFYEQKLATVSDSYKLKCIHGFLHSECLQTKDCSYCLEYKNNKCNKLYAGGVLVESLKNLGYESLAVYYRYEEPLIPDFKDLSSLCEWCLNSNKVVTLDSHSYIYNVISFISKSELIIKYKNKGFVYVKITPSKVTFESKNKDSLENVAYTLSI